MTEILCPTCGRPNVDDHNFCDYCGAPLFSVDPLPPDSPSLRDGLFDKEDEAAPVQPQESMDEASRLDSLFAPDEPLLDTPEEPNQPTSPTDDDSRLDDLIPAPVETPAETDPQPAEEPDASSRLDDLFADDDAFTKPKQEKEELSPPAFDPFLDPSARDALLGEDKPSDTDGGEWEYLTETSTEKSTTAEEPADDRDFFSKPTEDKSISQKEEPAPEPGDTLEFLTSLSDEEGPSLEDKPAQEPADDRDLSSKPTEDKSISQKEEPAPEPGDALEFLTSLSDEEGPSPEDKLAQEPADDRDLSSKPTEDKNITQQEEPAPEPGDAWDFLTSPSDVEEPTLKAEHAQEPKDEWDFLTSPTADETPSEVKKPAEDIAENLDFLNPMDGEEGESKTEESSVEPSRDWDFLTPDPDSEPAMIGFSPDMGDEEDDPIPDFGSPGFTDDSEWLDMLQDPATRAAAQAEAAGPPEPTKPQTDWLDKIKRLNKSSEIVDEDSSFPDWLSVSETPPEAPTDEVKPPVVEQPGSDEAEPSGDLPAWLQMDENDASLNEFLRRKDLTNEEYKPAIVRGITDDLPPQEEDDDGDDEPATGLSDSQQIKFPSWAEEKRKQGKIPEDLQFLAGDEDKPEEIVDPFQVEEEEFFDDLFSDELPGWLTSASTSSAFEDFDDELSHGELPGWVEAMRPVVESTDATGLSEDEDYIENYGPLAGIPSVLPAEAEVAIDPDQVPRKPLDLIATKSQKDFVNVLKKLISDENKTKTILKPAPVATQRVLRWLIAVIMLVTTAATVVFGGISVADPPTPAQVQNTGYGAFFDQIEALRSGQPVLIAHDYQPAAAGELHTAAAGVVDHLMKQGAYLSFISTQPTGPALAEHFLTRTQEEHNYVHTQQYINLGYLPGESAGLLSFVIAPKKIIPLAFDGSNAWGAPPLLKVDKINDFAMVLVITDDPDTAKIWIEQVGTILENTPLTMVVSAQVEPLIQPYFRASPQLLKGYVAGIIDSTIYEQLLGKPNLASKAWLPFNMGIIITVGTIFIGGLANGVMSLFSRHRARSSGEGK